MRTMRSFLLSLFIGSALCSQNLVVNPGFEISTTGQSGLVATAGVSGWSAPTKGTSDYIHPTNKERKVQAQETPAYAHIVPYDGKACAGIHGTFSAHEYLCGTLSSPLVKDSVYEISFALATAYNYEFDPARIGVYFTKQNNPYYRSGDDSEKIEVAPQVNLENSEKVSETGYWGVYKMNYTARGGEIRFIIGDFTDMYVRGMQGVQADYFFIDSVSVSRAKAQFLNNQEILRTSIDSITTDPVMNISSSDTLIAPGKTLVLENIYFETNKSRILPESYQPLYDIIVELKLQPNLKVVIVGHTDTEGDPEANLKLSQERAQAVADFFIAKGISASRLTTRGEGQKNPVSEEDWKNRRVEFIFRE